jgi:hypothetical protein
MITHLEGEMMRAIQRECKDTDDWILRLAPERKKKIDDEVAKAKSEDVYVNRLLFTQFCDKRTILKESPCPPCEPKQLEKDLKEIEKLRNKVAHANDYATTQKEAKRVCETVRLIDQWIGWLARWPSPSVRS